MKRITENIELWKDKLSDFESKAGKELAAIRKCKQEIQRIKDTLYRESTAMSDNAPANYIRDEKCLILSAPKIIIGNVDSQGVLLGGQSTVVVRGNAVHVEGCGSGEQAGGQIQLRAASIKQIAEDPGIDGQEGVVEGLSQIVTQARSINIISEDAEGMFTQYPVGSQGVTICSESHISLGAMRSNAVKSDNIAALKKAEKKRAEQLKSQAKKQSNQVQDLLNELKKVMKQNDDMENSRFDVRANFLDLDELYDQFGQLSTALFSSMSDYFSVLSQMAESNRRQKALDSMDSTLSKEKNSFKTKSTGTHINLSSETISALSLDGDGNYRENAEAGLLVNARTVTVQSQQADGSLHKDGGITLSAQNVDITTANPKVQDKKTEYPAYGNVNVVAKNMTFQAVDYQEENNKLQETALTKDGNITFRAQNMGMAATQTDGKATGAIHLNAKRVEVKSMDVDKEKRTDKDLAAGGAVKMVGEEIHVGAVDKKKHSKRLQLVSQKVVALADTTLEMQQGDGKALLQLDGGEWAASGSKVELYGKTTLQGATTFKADITAGDMDVKNLKVKTSFKSTNISDGIAVPGAPATAKLSAKLKEEELQPQTTK